MELLGYFLFSYCFVVNVQAPPWSQSLHVFFFGFLIVTMGLGGAKNVWMAKKLSNLSKTMSRLMMVYQSLFLFGGSYISMLY